MAAAMVARQGRAVVRTIAEMRFTVRQMSSKSANEYHEPGDHGTKKVWPDSAVSFDPYDQLRFPLPGNSAPALFATARPPLLSISSADADVLHARSSYQNQAEVFGQHRLREAMVSEASGTDLAGDIELKVQDCPVLMRKDFQLLFPGHNVMSGDFTVVSLCHRTVQDMSGWSEEVEEERDTLISLYSETAKELCFVLRNNGFWADFIDPCSGKPHLGPHTTDSMFEIDERYRHFGFEIEDFGCCKVIKHHKWGSKSFVGCVFTNAPVDSSILLELTEFTESTLDC
ncbi:cobalamin trafficking protein CblD-like [Watersipora subatra]|uniref:cobalamin trafficking protein CblD-like n=1 Tax=Watersipora subatra TaxID=2589382 RepID=UPI00355C7D6B